VKYLNLFLFIVFIPLFCMYIYQRKNRDFQNFVWGIKNRIGVWIAVALALIVAFAEVFFPSLAYNINIGWGESRDSDEFDYCFQWLIALTLLIFPHLVKKSYWSINPSSSEYHDRYKCSGYWYAGLGFSIIPIHTTWQLMY
jgi:hypothetical protein